ncbi:MAG: saccharopine dehydrogenase family protein [Thermoanaerobaculia bacterium]
MDAVDAAANTAHRELDLVLWGATGYTGTLVARELAGLLAAQNGSEAGARPAEARTDAPAWALGGRSREKLEALRRELAEIDPAAAGLPLVVADALDPSSLEPMVRRARVVCTTVGPYERYGTPLVELCAAHGTDCCDLSGEIPWMRRTVDRFHDAARESGARIVHGCGFDSIPSDLGTLLLHHRLEAAGSGLKRARLRVRKLQGGASGGTVATAFGIIEQARRDPGTRRILLDPYALSPPGEREGPDRNSGRRPALDPDRAMWTAPFLMAMINTRVVRRTNALLGYPYGRDFRYDERVDAGPGFRGRLRAQRLAWTAGGLTTAAALPPTAWLLRRFVLPEPGEGPSEEQRERGAFRIDLFGEGRPVDRDGPPPRARITVAADRDPGYGATARMLATSALELVTTRRSGEAGSGGVLTPAAALGLPLVERLQGAGIAFETVPDAP